MTSNNNIRDNVLKLLQTHPNYPMIDDLVFYQEKDAVGFLYRVRLILKNQFEFNHNYLNRMVIRLNNFNNVDEVANRIKIELDDAQFKDYYLYRRIEKMDNYENFEIKVSAFANSAFHKSIKKLSKPELRIACNYAYLDKYQSSNEIVEDLRMFWHINGRYPYKTEPLYKTIEFAKETNYLTETNIISINNIASANSFEKLSSFIEENKRFPYETESEYMRTWNEVCFNYKEGNYTKEQLIKLEILWSKYNNGSDSIGERMVNSTLAGMGYTIEKQKTFDDLKCKHKLRFDTCINVDGKLALIEFDGIQHFEPVPYFGGIIHLMDIQIRDDIKNNYCKDHNIPLLRIRYDEIKNIENIINDFIDTLKGNVKRLELM